MNKLPEKPQWLKYGEEVRQQLANMPARKSTPKLSRRLAEESFAKARDKLKYEGEFSDWLHVIRYRGWIER